MLLQTLTDIINVPDLLLAVNIPEGLADTLSGIKSSIEAIAKQTHPSPWTIFNIILSGGALIASLLGVFFSSRTARNVRRINNKIQVKLLKDLIRHLYRNKVCTLAMAAKMEKNGYTEYPAEGHLLKLKTLPGDIHLEQYNANIKNYSRMHQLSLLLRNYNAEIDVAKEHLCNPATSEEVKRNDLDNLLFKPFYLIFQITETIERLERGNSSKTTNKILLSQHFSLLAENSNKDSWAAKDNSTATVMNTPDRGLNLLVKKLKEESPVENSKDILSKKNEYMTGKLKTMLLPGNNISQEVKELMDEELKAAKISGPDWNVEQLLPVALATDLLIEIPKIKMIPYPATTPKPAAAAKAKQSSKTK